MHCCILNGETSATAKSIMHLHFKMIET
uniref:Uncharacterized protein n=1 Tax=Rhizophora mucronata TaxID=61149 RepID=A0A2P2NNN0_RHIMU